MTLCYPDRPRLMPRAKGPVRRPRRRRDAQWPAVRPGAQRHGGPPAAGPRLVPTWEKAGRSGPPRQDTELGPPRGPSGTEGGQCLQLSPEGPVCTSDLRKRTTLTELFKSRNLKRFVTDQRDLSPAQTGSFGHHVPTAGAWHRPREASGGGGAGTHIGVTAPLGRFSF